MCLAWRVMAVSTGPPPDGRKVRILPLGQGMATIGQLSLACPPREAVGEAGSPNGATRTSDILGAGVGHPGEMECNGTKGLWTRQPHAASRVTGRRGAALAADASHAGVREKRACAYP